MNLEHCIRCTICVENCPVYRANPDFPGPKQAGPDAQRFRIEKEKPVDKWVLLCCQCKRCDMACPHGVDPAEIILEAQQRYGMQHAHPLANRLFAHNYYLSTLGSLSAPIANRIAGSYVGKKVFQAMGINTHIPFPAFSFRTLKGGKKKRGQSARRAAFFYGCFINFYRPDIGRKLMGLLESFHVDCVLPPQWCCGLPALGNGDRALALYFARKNAASLSDYIDAGYDVVYACTSCGLSLLQDYPGILGLPQAKRIAEKTYNVHEYIDKLIEEGYVKPQFREVKRKVAYHIPCHLRAMAIGYPAARILSRIPGLECAILDDTCCGLNGSYGFKKKNLDTSVQLGRRAVSLIRKTDAEAITADCGSCRMQLGGLSGLPALDPIEILSESLGIGSEKVPDGLTG